MAVYDCFPFFNENDLLELRLNQHWDFVDKFIITEAGETHTGLPKPFNFDRDRFKQYESKIIYSQIPDFSPTTMNRLQSPSCKLLDNHSRADRSGRGQHTDDWIRDHFQGNYPVKVLLELGAKDSDIVYISALDEILNENGFIKGIERFSDNKHHPVRSGGRPLGYGSSCMLRPLFGFTLDMYIYKFNLFSVKQPGPAMMEVGVFAGTPDMAPVLPSTARSLALDTHTPIEDAGWHFSWLDDTKGEKILLKQKSWAHSRDRLANQKVKFSHTTIDEALERLFIDYEMREVPICAETHPAYLVQNLDKYSNYISPAEGTVQ